MDKGGSISYCPAVTCTAVCRTAQQYVNNPPLEVFRQHGQGRLHQCQVVGEEARQPKVNQTDLRLHRGDRGEGRNAQISL